MGRCYSGCMDEALREVLQNDPRIAFALRFGSSARGEATPLSDIDVAVGLKPGEHFDAHAIGALVSALESATGHTIDLVLVDDAPPGLAYRVFRDGQLLMEADRRARVDREVRAILEYLDFEPLERLCAEGVLRGARG